MQPISIFKDINTDTMKKFLLIAVASIAMLACENGDAVKTDIISQKDQEALKFLVTKPRTMIGQPERDVVTQIESYGFEELVTPQESPAKMPTKTTYWSRTFYLNAPAIKGWPGFSNISLPEGEVFYEAFNEVINAGKVYVEAKAGFEEGKLIGILSRVYMLSQDRTSEVLSLVSQTAYDDLPAGKDGWKDWRAEASNDVKERKFSSWEDLKAFLDESTHVEAFIEGNAVYQNNPLGYDIEAEYVSCINWTDDVFYTGPKFNITLDLVQATLDCYYYDHTASEY